MNPIRQLKSIIENDQAKERLAMCESCPNYIKFTRQCNLCGCFMYAKVLIPNAHCPQNKW